MKSQLAGSFFIESSKPPASIAQSNKQWVRPARTQIVQKFSKVHLRFSPYNNCRKKDCKNPPKVNDGKAEAEMNRKRKNEKKTIGLAALLVASQLFQVANVSADSQEYSGVTQIASEDVYLDVNDLEVSLEVAEVCVAAGDSVQEGDVLLKLTSDSYEKAVAYYTAALLRARSSLTDTQLEYDQGILAAKYTYEMAQAEAENAESVKEYQTNEVTGALTEHADTLEDITDRIEELTDGIADGSYATGSSSSGGTSGTGSTGGGSASGKASDGKQESETQSEGGQQESSTSGNEQESNAQTESETGSSEQKSNDQQQTDNNIGSGTPEKSVAELKQELTATLEEMDTRGTSITETLKQLTDRLSTEETDNQSDYDTYANQLNNLITELTADIRTQEQAKEKLQAGSETALDDSIAGNTRVLESLQDIQKRLQKYQGLIGTVLGLLDAGNASVMVDADMLEDITEYIQLQEKCSSLYNELVTRYEKELADNANTPNETLPNGSGSDSSKETEAGSDDTKSDTQETEGNGSQSDIQNPETGESESGSGMNGQPSTEEGADREGSTGGGMPSGSSGNSMASGFSGGTGSMSSGASADSSSAGVAQSGQSASMGTDGFDMSSADISILGNAYDLTQVKNLLEQEPSDEDAAEDLLEQLTDSLEEVQTQYEELQRMEKIYKLQIQYTYDTTKLAAQLAEITYEQELLEWENTLSEAKEEQETIEEQKAMLDAMTDGTICAQQNGIVASVSYDEGDVISSSVPVISYYDTDTVTVTLEIPQEEIAGIAVGQTVKVQMDRFGTIEGTVSEKSVEPESGTSRTNVIYTVEVSIENETGRINSGTAATVTFSEAENAGEEGQE